MRARHFPQRMNWANKQSIAPLNAAAVFPVGVGGEGEAVAVVEDDDPRGKTESRHIS